jgi:hypothetical protein
MNIFISKLLLILVIAYSNICLGHTPEKAVNNATISSKLKADWLFQADNNPTIEKSEFEISRAFEIAKNQGGTKNNPKLVPLLDKLKRLGQDLIELKQSEDKAKTEEIYLATRAIKREIMLADPAVDFNKILFIDNPYPMFPRYKMWAGPISTRYRENTIAWDHESRHRNGFAASPGGKLMILEGLNPDAPTRNLMPEHEGSFWRPDLSYDGEKILMSYQPKDDLSFHIYEIGVDGKGFKQLTKGDYDDLDPIYLPDDHIMFSTSRANTYVRCLPWSYAFVLARCDNDGKNIYITSRNMEPDYLPSVLNDGRVIYTRWEYTDKPLWRLQKLWACKPDGTGVSMYWGNQSVWPDVVTEARSIPGTDKVMFTGVGHHQWFNGSIGIIDPEKGLNYPDGISKITGELEWPEVGDGPQEKIASEKYQASGKFKAYKSPYPISERLFLVSARKGKIVKEKISERGFTTRPADKNGFFALYLMDIDGNKELIYQGDYNVLYPMPVKARKRPRVFPDRVKWPDIATKEKPAEGILYSNNVFQNSPDLPKDKVKYMRIIKMVPKTYSTWFKEANHDGPSIAVSQAESIKEILGTVPVEEDGSVSFNLEPGIAVYFQLLDEEYRCIKTMRSFTGVMPGEIRGCKGCHESSSNTPTNIKKSIANSKAPSTIKPPSWGDETVGYKRFVQVPVFDKYCAECHQGNGKAVDKLNLTFRPSTIKRHDGFPNYYNPQDSCVFNEPFVEITTKKWLSWATDLKKNKHYVPDNLSGVLVVEGYDQKDDKALKTLPAMSAFSVRSKIVENATSGNHHGVKVTGEDLERLIAWTDCNGPYYGLEELKEMYDPWFYNIDKLPVRPRVATAPEINRFAVRQDGDSKAIAGEVKLYDGNVKQISSGKKFERVRPGRIVDYNFFAHKKGSYQVVLVFEHRSRQVNVDISLNDKLIKNDFELPGKKESSVNLGRLDLNEGDNTLLFALSTTKNSPNKNYTIKIKNIQLTP